jgi:hypothetical protein
MNLRGSSIGVTAGRDVKCLVEMGLGGSIYIPGFVTIGPGDPNNIKITSITSTI